MNDNRRKLYDALSEEYDLGSFEQFNSDIQNAEKRKKLYDATIEEYDFGDYDSFSRQLGFASPVNESSYTFTEQELKEKFGPEENDEPVVPMSNVFQFGMAPVNMAQTTSNAGGGRAEKPLTSLANPYDEKRYSGFSRREIEWLAQQPEEVRRERISDDVLMAQMEKIAREDIDTRELKHQLSELTMRTGAELERYAQERGAKQAQEEEKKPLWRRVLENIPKSGGVPSPLPDYTRDNASLIGDVRWNTLKAADSLNKESQSIIEAVEKDKGFVGGMANKLSDIETWLPMLTAMKSAEILQLVDKFEKGEELTKDEENLLDALAVNVVVKQAYGNDVSNAYSAGQSVAEMPGFMAEMAINPLSGASNMLVSRLGKYAAKKGIGAILRAGAKAVGATAAGAGMAVTTGLPRTAADTMSRMAGQADYEIVDGKVEYAGQVNRENAFEAGYKAVAEGAIQNASEMVGAEWATRGVTKVGKKVLEASKAGRRVLKVLDEIENSAAGKAVKAFQNATKWNGTIEEFIEEIEAGVGSAVFVGDQEIKDVFDRDNLATIFLAVLAPGVTMGAVQTAGAVGGYYTERYRTNRELNRARREVEELMGEDAAEYIDALDSADEKTMNAILAYVDESELPKEQKIAIMKYAAAKLKSDVSTSVLDVLATEEDAELEAAFTQGTETEPTPENKQVARTALQRAEEEMRSRLGWDSEADIELFLREHSAEELAMGDEQTLRAINNYKREKAFVEGMRESIQGRREERYAEVDKSIDRNANKVDGNVYSTTYKGEEVFITGGNVVLNDNGTVDYDASSDALYITFLDGHTEQVAAKNFTATVKTESAEELKAAKHLEIDSELDAEMNTYEQQGAPVENTSETSQVEMPNVPDNFRMNGVNYSVVSRNDDGSLTVRDAKGKMSVMPQGADYANVLPTDKKGNVDFTAMPVEKTVSYFVERIADAPTRAEMIENNRKAAEKEVEKYSKRPNVGTDPDAYAQIIEQWNAGKAAAQAKVDYWGRVEDMNKNIQTSEMQEALEAIKPDVAEMTADEFIAVNLPKITPESFKRETGLSGSEQRQLVGIIAGADKGGVTIEQAAEIIYENYIDELQGLGFNGDVQDIRNTIIGILSGGNPRSYANNSREKREAENVEQQRTELEGIAKVLHFDTIGEQIAYEETVIPRIIRDYKDFDEIEYYNNLAKNYENDTTRESESTGRGSELLQGEQTADNTGTGDITESGQRGEVQGDVYIGGENGTPQGNQQVNEPVGEADNQSEDNLEMVAEGGNAPGQGDVVGNNTVNVLQNGNNELNLQKENESNDESNQNDIPVGGQVSQSVPQGEYGEVAPLSGGVQETAARLRERIESAQGDSKSGLREVENRVTREFAQENGLWIENEFKLGVPFPSGDEHNNYIDAENQVVYKVNNRMHTPSILDLLDRIEQHNNYFPNTQYGLVGFTSVSDNGDVMPVFAQDFVLNARMATVDEIDSYMGTLGFTRVGDGRYSNGEVVIKDLKPRNVLVNPYGDVFVVDAEFEQETEISENGGENSTLEQIKAELGPLNRDNAAEYARRLFAVSPWKTLEEANTVLKELLASYGETLSGQTLGVVPFLDEARNLIIDNDIAELKEQNAVADERQQRIGLPPRVSDYSKAITEGDAEAMKEWEGRFDDYMSKLLPADIPALDSTIRGMQGNKDAIKTGDPKGYKENPNYKAFDYIEKALKKLKREIEDSVKSEIEERIKNNFAAIETVKQLLESGEEPNDAQREIVSKFDGWSGLEDWHDEIVLRLKDILSDANEYTVEALGNEHAFDGLEGALQKLADNETNTTQAELQQGTLSLDEGSEALERATEETMNALAKTGVEVVMATEEQVNDMLGLAEMQKRTAPETVSVQDEHLQTVVSSADKRNKSLETALPEDETSFKGTAISSDNGTKVLKNIDKAIAEYENKSNQTKTFVGDIANALEIDAKDKSSKYATFEAKNGKVFTIRISNHNATVSNFDNLGEGNGISIVVSRADNAGITNDGDAHLVEFFYSDKKLKSAEGKPLVEILKSIKQALYSGEYKDNTGLAVREEVNIPEMMTVFHGSGAKFDKFDHSYMGTGEGAQAFGWGSYVTEVEGIGRTYAESTSGNIFKSGFGDFYLKKIREGLAEGKSFEEIKQNLLEFHAHLYEQVDGNTEMYGEFISDYEKLQSLKEEDLPKRNLYFIEIPDDNGSNYLHWEEVVPKKIETAVKERLLERLSEGQGEAYKSDLKQELDDVFRYSDFDGASLYKNISAYLGGDKQASLFLSDMGFVGISYPAEAMTGGRKDGARNYVIFNENDAQITDRVEFLRTSNGTVYGWAVDGKIFLTPDGINPNTPVHEYTHLWASAVEQRDPKLWAEIVGAMKLSPVWAEVAADEAYRDIWNNDNRMASEVLSRLSGAENYRRAMERAQADIKAERNVIEKIKKIAGWESVKRALSDFWNKVKELLDMPVKGEPESDAPAWLEFVNSAIGDFYEGVNPNVTESPMEGMFIGEKGARNLDRIEEENGDFNFDPRREVSTEEREKKMNTRTEELAKALNERGFETTISKSRTSFGMSNYITVRSKNGEVLKKIRLSDHSVTNNGRVLNEYHTMSTDTVEGIVADLMGEKEREIGNRSSNLTNAKIMERRGKDAKTIKLATGWERGADGKWRYETPDAKVNREAQLFGLNDNKRYPIAGFIEKGRVDIDGTVRLDKLIDEEALFDAYPELREYYVTFEEMESGIGGSYSHDEKVIRFNRRKSIDKLTSTLNHEIQHAIQHIEGFALGSSPEYFEELDRPKYVYHDMHLVRAKADELLREGKYKNLRSAVKNAFKEYLQNGWLESRTVDYYELNTNESWGVNNFIDGAVYFTAEELHDFSVNNPDPKDQYWRTAGEVESRNVQERMGMTPEERRKSLAEETADVAKEDQIFLFDNQGTSAMMGSRVNARMAQVASKLDARELSPEQRAVADVFGGKADNLTISVKTQDGNERKVVMRQGNEMGAGAKHSLYRHYNTGSGAITADDVLLIPEVIANGERTEKMRGRKTVVEYKYTDNNGVEYTVITEKIGNKEIFNNFYTNKKTSDTRSSNTLAGVQNRDIDTFSSARMLNSDASADKGNTKSANSQATDEILSQQDSDEVAMTKGAINSLGEKLNTPIKILEDTTGLDEREKKAKGWYDTKTGEVVIVLPNNISLDDAIETVLHELVGHKGLRAVMGEEFDSFLDFVYENATPEMKRDIKYRFLSSIREGRTMTLRECTEEYIASLAERGFDGYSGVWNAIKQWLRDFFRRFTDVNVSDGELRYLLWKSYNRLQRGPIAQIEDIAMEAKTNTGNRANRFREVTTDGLKKRYDERVEGIWNRFKEGWIDATRSMRVAQEEIQKEVGRVIADSADFFNFTNTVPSRNRNKMDRFEVQLMNPFLKFLNGVLTDKDISEKDLERYTNAKHGIERNREMAVKEAMYEVIDGKRVFNAEAYEEYKKRKGDILTNGKSWIEQQNELDALAVSFGVKIKDYSGLTAIFDANEKMNYADLRKAATTYVAEMEAELGEEDTKTLWKHINGINGFSQNEALESGRISKEVFDANAQRYQYYVPLRGFSETTADEMYDYVSEQKSVLNSAQKGAKGRWSEADNIFATMLNIANSEIIFGNKNLAKQRLLNCALLYKTSLLSVGEAWYEKGDNDLYTPIYPNISENMSNEKIAAEVKAFEERCKVREKKGEVTRKRPGVELQYKAPEKWERNQHAVSVMRNGREYIVYVNGSPRLAQAMNGLLMEKDTNGFFNVTDAINRFRAQMVTGYSPKFVVTNGVRDIQESTVYFFAKYGVSIAKKFAGNVMEIMPNIHKLFRLYEKNELDMNNKMHRYFKEFLENGGETGYSAMLSIEEYEKKINDNIKAKSVLDMSKGVLESAQDLVEFANRAVENVCRFAAYMTSRENGLSVLQSVADAKNVSVNFNRKGSGAAGNLEARKLFMFLNPAIQSLVRRVELTRKYPKRMAMVWATELALGAALPVIWNVVYDLLGGDDDEALNNYYNLSDFTRRANLCIPLSDGVVKIPLSHEARVLYSLGEVMTSAINGHSEYDNVTADVFNSFAQILPLNPMEGWAPGDNIGEALAMNLSPDAIKFIPEILLNKDFAGNRVHNASDFNKHLPQRLRGKRGTAKVYQMVSDILSGDYERNFFDEQLGEFITPSSIEHIVKSYLGGMYSTANELVKTAQWIGGDEEYAEFKNVPIANVFYQSLEKYEAEPGERTRRDWEKAYQNFFEVVGRDYDAEKTAKDLIKNGDDGAISKLQEMENRGELLRIDIFNDGQKRLKELYEEKDAARNMKDYTLSDEIDKRIYATKRELVTRMETLADDPMSGYLMLTGRDDSEYGVRETYGDVRDMDIINEFQRSIKPIIDGAKQSENRTKYTNAYSKEFEMWRKLKRCEERISKRKKSMENNPDEGDRYMMEIRNLRAEAVKLINDYE